MIWCTLAWFRSCILGRTPIASCTNPLLPVKCFRVSLCSVMPHRGSSCCAFSTCVYTRHSGGQVIEQHDIQQQLYADNRRLALWIFTLMRWHAALARQYVIAYCICVIPALVADSLLKLSKLLTNALQLWAGNTKAKQSLCSPLTSISITRNVTRLSYSQRTNNRWRMVSAV